MTVPLVSLWMPSVLSNIVKLKLSTSRPWNCGPLKLGTAWIVSSKWYCELALGFGYSKICLQFRSALSPILIGGEESISGLPSLPEVTILQRQLHHGRSYRLQQAADPNAPGPLRSPQQSRNDAVKAHDARLKRGSHGIEELQQLPRLLMACSHGCLGGI